MFLLCFAMMRYQMSMAGAPAPRCAQDGNTRHVVLPSAVSAMPDTFGIGRH